MQPAPSEADKRLLLFSTDFLAAFERPTLFYTLAGNPYSERVLGYLRGLFGRLTIDNRPVAIVFENEAALRTAFEGAYNPTLSVVLFDGNVPGYFRPCPRGRAGEPFAPWGQMSPWGVRIGHQTARNENRTMGCANQIFADFHANFERQLKRDEFPWGYRRKGERPPRAALLPVGTDALIERLNQGPDLAAAVANADFALELPRGSRISWYRVVPVPVQARLERLTRVNDAFRSFEIASARIARDVPGIREELLAGVHLSDPRAVDLYLDPPTDSFSVRRPDLHVMPDGSVFASENDEMPGGLAELVHLDYCYGINQDRWHRAFDYLCADGLLLFVVSHDWSRVYRAELEWLTGFMSEQGYPVGLVSTDELGSLTINNAGVHFAGRKVGTVWRQFPVFETEGVLLDLVSAARRGIVRMIPEFGHWGNKSWFALWRSERALWRDLVSTEDAEILDEVLPHSRLIRPPGNPVFSFGHEPWDEIAELRRMPDVDRDKLVLKIAGANRLAARSHGVLMGTGLSDDTWRGWIDERVRNTEPFIVQHRLPTAVERIVVRDTRSNTDAVFDCRVLLRPWSCGGEIVSAAACAVPADTLRVHGRVDMAVIPVRCS